ncbi:hypothetical protein VNO77_43447 [Canavalia gladiata]|uniref:Uncharacterized protein n=1 Tax=Canavalia gladiata TaxID=3824 RepID=A0AAN9PPE3_CANGL
MVPGYAVKQASANMIDGTRLWMWIRCWPNFLPLDFCPLKLFMQGLLDGNHMGIIIENLSIRDINLQNYADQCGEAGLGCDDEPRGLPGAISESKVLHRPPYCVHFIYTVYLPCVIMQMHHMPKPYIIQFGYMDIRSSFELGNGFRSVCIGLWISDLTLAKGCDPL